MAKVGAFQRGWRGKFAGAVFANADGGTVARELVIPKNPRTAGQMANRVILATVSQAAALMKPIINHSFEGYAYGVKSVRRFQQLNNKALRKFAAMDFRDTPAAVDANVFMTTKDVSALIPNKYVIARGSLNPSPVKVVSMKGQNVIGAGTGELQLRIPGFTAGNSVTLSTAETAAAGVRSVKVADIVQALFGLNTVEEQITLCMITSVEPANLDNADFIYQYSFNDDDAPGFQIPYTTFKACRLCVGSMDALNATINITNNGALIENISEAVSAAVEAVFSTSEKSSPEFLEFVTNIIESEGNFQLSSDGHLVIIPRMDDMTNTALYTLADAMVYAAGIIHSRYESEKWRRSNADMIIATPTSGVENFGLLWAIAPQAWLQGAIIAESEKYLNEGGDTDTIGSF